MNRTIIFEKQYEDIDCFGARVQCESQVVKAETDICISFNSLEEFIEKLERFLQQILKKIDAHESWQSGEFGDNSTPCVSFEFFNKDSLGHIQIEVKMEIDDGGKLSEHICCFYVFSEVQEMECLLNDLKQCRFEERC